MNKIECEICGTQYPDSAAACPICGWTHNDAAAADAAASAGAEEFDLDFLNEDASVAAEVEEPAPAPAPVKKNKGVFDYDAVNAPPVQEPEDEEVDEDEDEDDEDDEEEEEDDEEESGGSAVLVVILVILIVALLLASGFIFWRYYLPNHRGAQEPAATELIDVQPSEAEATEPEIVTVPCTGLSLVSGMEKLSSEGQHWLLHIKAVPEDTTDEIVFVSEDESIVTVNEEGRVTAVGEGETRIVITCGAQKIECPAVVDYTPEETVAVVETTAPAEVAPETEDTPAEVAPEGEAAPEETSAPVNSDVTLKLKRTDITFGVRGVYIELALDCELTPDQVTWSSRNANVAAVNSKGEVTAVGPGLTVITAKYGDQSVECIVRCNF